MRLWIPCEKQKGILQAVWMWKGPGITDHVGLCILMHVLYSPSPGIFHKPIHESTRICSTGSIKIMNQSAVTSWLLCSQQNQVSGSPLLRCICFVHITGNFSLQGWNSERLNFPPFPLLELLLHPVENLHKVKIWLKFNISWRGSKREENPLWSNKPRWIDLQLL